MGTGSPFGPVLPGRLDSAQYFMNCQAEIFSQSKTTSAMWASVPFRAFPNSMYVVIESAITYARMSFWPDYAL